MNAKPVSEHVREHRSLLAGAEKRTLIWIAKRMPRWVTSDQLTLLGLLSMFVAGCCYWASRWHKGTLPLVVVALALNWFGDSLDGTLARVRNHQRPRYGFYVDHVIDILGMLFLIGGLALSGFMSPLISLGLLVAYLMVTAEVFLATCVQGIFRLASLGFGPTELRIVLSVGTLYLLRSPVVRVAGMGPFKLFDVGGIVAMAGLGLAFLLSAARNTRDLYRAEPLVC
jgi:phosphatidylglycerophosphate synthase